ncbi:MAG: F0F1 ATP synthase subunit A [Alphaproteobacteria bacterium]|nr:F0F1 ATP synthase subunit A [Alphaproteobacteria bacterium]
MSGPIEQFNIVPLVELEIAGIDVSFTNSALFMTLAVVICPTLLTLAMNKKALIPGPWQSLAELLYEFIGGLVKENVGQEGMKYFPFIFSIFLYICMGNLLGLLPYSFTYTSHLAAVGGLAFCSLILLTILGLKRNGVAFLHVFFPSGAPLLTSLVLVPIEMISFLSRPFSLTVRLVANMTVGHIMLKIIAGFVFGLGVFGIVPLAFASIIIVFETGIAILQAYIFTMLCCIYLNDAIHVH